MANGCYSLAGDPIYFKPTDLGTYLLYDADRKFVIADGERADAPSAATVWTVTKSGPRFTFTDDGSPLTIDGADDFTLTRTSGCTPYPESQIDVEGDPHAGITPYQEVRGYVDAHTHGMAFEFLGGDVHCGKPWDQYGAPYALVDCPDHTATGGYGGVLESVLSGEPHHDPIGWPTFKDWPAPNSLTHEGTYYRWLERSWRGGQRIFVNLLVENNQLCQLYPIKHNSCDDMDSVRLQAQDMYQMQDYIDAQFGGPGKGFYRIVKNPFQARKVINAGKMAVIMGIETSVPVRLHVQGAARRRRPGHGLHAREPRHPARRREEDGRAPDGAGQQVRQRTVGDRRRQRRGGGGRQRGQLPRDRLLLGHEALRARRPGGPRPQPGRRTRHLGRPAGRALRCDRQALRPAQPVGHPGLPAA